MREAADVHVIELHDVAKGSVALHRLLMSQLRFRGDRPGGTLDGCKRAAAGERVQVFRAFDGGEQRAHHTVGLRILTGDARDQLAAVEGPEPLATPYPPHPP